MKKLIITLIAFGLNLGVAQAQEYGSGNMDGPGMEGPNFDVPADIDPAILEEITTLRSQVMEIREELKTTREAVLAELGDEATREERIAALAKWQSDNAADIADVRTLTEELRLLIRENRPVPPVVEVPDEIVAKREELRERRVALAESRRQAILALGENPTDEAVRAAVEAWRAANGDEIEAVRVLALEVRQWFRQNRPQRKPAFETQRMQQRRDQFRENMVAMKQTRQELRQQLRDPDLTEAGRHQLLQNFREQQRDMMREHQMLKRQERLDQGGLGGDRRPGG